MPTSSLPPPLFDTARERLLSLVAGYGFRPARVEYEQDSAFAEYWGRGLRLRLVWEGREQALWVDVAPEAGGEVVGRWRDVEWEVAGQKLPLDQDTTDARVERLLDAVRGCLEARR